MRSRQAAFVVAVIALVLVSITGNGQSAPGSTPAPQAQAAQPPMDPEVAKDRRYALELHNSGKVMEACEWFEKLAPKLPADFAVQEGWADCLVRREGLYTDVEKRRELRKQAWHAYKQLYDSGDHSDVVQVMLSMLSADGGSESVFSDNKEVDRLMHAGDDAFVQRRLDEAKDNYLKALVLNPKLYTAALFLGDVYYQKGDGLGADQWFLRATQIDPDREAAWRYWGDSLLQRRRFSEAREKFIAAVICDPYTQKTWGGVNNYSRAARVKPTWHKVNSPNKTEKKDENNINIALDESHLTAKDGSGAWLGYELNRAYYLGDGFKKEFPNEPKYRHTLKEESAGLSLVAEMAEGYQKRGEKLNDDLAFLVRLKKAGLLEPYILITLADDDITKDYAEYRKQHRDLLERYLKEIVVPPPPAEGTTGQESK